MDLQKISLPYLGNPRLFLTQVRDELGRVIWPTRQGVVKATALVLTVSIVVALFIGGLDFVFTKLMELVVKR